VKPNLTKLRAEYGKLQKQLAATGWISHGYVQDRGPGAGGPCYQWTRKENKKTVSVALSQEQYEAMKEAIANWRVLQRALVRMEQVTRLMIFRTLPDTRRRKPLTKRVLGLN
jgi:cyclopropane fatty-acyl-phospholipid synthase-like methyltransferase